MPQNYSSIWASTDGSSWQLLLDDPVPAGPPPVGSSVIYAQNVPGSLLGATQFWVQVRMYEHAALVDTYPPAAEWADAQFSRYDPQNPSSGNNFELDVTTVPEPSFILLGTCGMLALGWTGQRRASTKPRCCG